jgi:hypothetical protein
MEVFLNGSGRVNHEITQQKWFGKNTKIMQVSTFSGQEMNLIQKSDEEPNLYVLNYLGFKTDGILGIETAKSLAPEFAKTVLKKMSESIN